MLRESIGLYVAGLKEPAALVHVVNRDGNVTIINERRDLLGSELTKHLQPAYKREVHYVPRNPDLTNILPSHKIEESDTQAHLIVTAPFSRVRHLVAEMQQGFLNDFPEDNQEYWTSRMRNIDQNSCPPLTYTVALPKRELNSLLDRLRRENIAPQGVVSTAHVLPHLRQAGAVVYHENGNIVRSVCFGNAYLSIREHERALEDFESAAQESEEIGKELANDVGFFDATTIDFADDLKTVFLLSNLPSEMRAGLIQKGLTLVDWADNGALDLFYTGNVILQNKTVEHYLALGAALGGLRGIDSFV